MPSLRAPSSSIKDRWWQIWAIWSKRHRGSRNRKVTIAEVSDRHRPRVSNETSSVSEQGRDRLDLRPSLEGKPAGERNKRKLARIVAEQKEYEARLTKAREAVAADPQRGREHFNLNTTQTTAADHLFDQRKVYPVGARVSDPAGPLKLRKALSRPPVFIEIGMYTE